MKIEQQIKALCTPAKIYFIISVLFILAVLITGFTNSKKLEVMLKATIIKLLFVLVWTYILQELCKYGYKNLSWFIVLLPFLVMSSSFILAHL